MDFITFQRIDEIVTVLVLANLVQQLLYRTLVEEKSSRKSVVLVLLPSQANSDQAYDKDVHRCI